MVIGNVSVIDEMNTVNFSKGREKQYSQYARPNRHLCDKGRHLTSSGQSFISILLFLVHLYCSPR